MLARVRMALMLAIFLRGIALPAATQITAAAPQPHVISTPEVVKLMKTGQPICPQAAVRKAIEGVVFLKLTVAKDGSVSEVSVVKGTPILAGAATQAAKQWRYDPFRLNNESVELSIRCAVNFSLVGHKR